MFILYFFLIFLCILCLIYIVIQITYYNSKGYAYSSYKGGEDNIEIRKENSGLEQELDLLIDEATDKEGVIFDKIQKLLEENKKLRYMLANPNLSTVPDSNTMPDRLQIIYKIHKNEEQIQLIEEYIKKDINTKRKINNNIKNILL